MNGSCREPRPRRLDEYEIFCRTESVSVHTIRCYRRAGGRFTSDAILVPTHRVCVCGINRWCRALQFSAGNSLPNKVKIWKKTNKFSCATHQGHQPLSAAADVNKHLAKSGNTAPGLLMGRPSRPPLVGRPVNGGPHGRPGPIRLRLFVVTSHAWPWLVLFWNVFC